MEAISPGSSSSKRRSTSGCANPAGRAPRSGVARQRAAAGPPRCGTARLSSGGPQDRCADPAHPRRGLEPSRRPRATARSCAAAPSWRPSGHGCIEAFDLALAVPLCNGDVEACGRSPWRRTFKQRDARRPNGAAHGDARVQPGVPVVDEERGQARPRAGSRGAPLGGKPVGPIGAFAGISRRPLGRRQLRQASEFANS